MGEPLIVLTGAAGRIGTTVYRTLLEAGKKVRATDRMPAVSPDLPLVKGNLYSSASCRKLMEGADILVHLAFRREPRGYLNGYPPHTFDDHIRMNREVFQAACEMGVKKVVFSSSIQVIARQLPVISASQLPPSLPLDENSPAEPDNWYSLSKWCSEQMLAMLRRQYGIDYTVIRFPTLTNPVPMAHPEWYAERRSEALSFLSIRDAADLILKVIEADLPGARTYLPASRQNTLGVPLMQLVRQHFTGVPFRRPPEELDNLIDLTTLKKDLGWEPRDRSQPNPTRIMPLMWRLRHRLFNLAPESWRLYVKRWVLGRP